MTIHQNGLVALIPPAVRTAGGEAYGPVTASIRELFRKAKVGAADWELIRQWRAEGDGGG